MKQIKALTIAFWNVLKQVPSFYKEKLDAWLDTDLGDGDYDQEVVCTCGGYIEQIGDSNRCKVKEHAYPERTRVAKWDGSLYKHLGVENNGEKES